MGTTDRRQRHRASLRREILDAASRLFVDEGYERLTMRRLAERIEYSPTTLYLHFKDKNELLQAVCDETFSQLAGQLERLEKTAATPLGYLREALRAYVESGTAHPNEYTVAFLRPNPGVEGASFEHSAGSRAFDALRRGVRACSERGDIRAADVDITAQVLWAGVHGLTSLFIAMPGFPFAARPALVDHAIDTLLAGLKAQPAAPRTQPPKPARPLRHDFLD